MVTAIKVDEGYKVTAVDDDGKTFELVLTEEKYKEFLVYEENRIREEEEAMLAENFEARAEAGVIENDPDAASAGTKKKRKSALKTGVLFHINRIHSYETHAENPDEEMRGMSEEKWCGLVINQIKTIAETFSDNIEWIQYIFHNMDEPDEKAKKRNPDLKYKPLHVHILVHFKKEQNREVVAAAFYEKSGREQNCQIVREAYSMVKYLIHISDDALNKKKHVYSPKQVGWHKVSYETLLAPSYWEGKGAVKALELNGVLSDKGMKRWEMNAIRSQYALKVYGGVLSAQEAVEALMEEVGYDYVSTNQITFDFDSKLYVRTIVRQLTKHNRDLLNIYISGPGGVGKSTLAHALAWRLTKNTVFNAAPAGEGKTPDFAQGYTDQDVVVIDEMEARSWALSEFYRVFDPEKYSPMPSRNINVDFIGRTMIFTNSIQPLQFANDLVVYSKGGKKYQDPTDKTQYDKSNEKAVDKFWQAVRRMKVFLMLRRNDDDSSIIEAHVFVLRKGFDADGEAMPDNGVHVYVGKSSFPAVEQLDHEELKKKEVAMELIPSETLDEIIALMATDVSEMTGKVPTIYDYLEEHGYNERKVDGVLQQFVSTFVNETAWRFVPTDMLFDFYKAYSQRFEHESRDLLKKPEFNAVIKPLMAEHGWVHTGKKAQRPGDDMSAHEPMIQRYGLDKAWGYYARGHAFAMAAKRKIEGSHGVDRKYHNKFESASEFHRGFRKL